VSVEILLITAELYPKKIAFIKACNKVVENCAVRYRADNGSGVQTIDNNRNSYVTGHGSWITWVSSLMGQMGHKSQNVTHFQL